MSEKFIKNSCTCKFCNRPFKVQKYLLHHQENCLYNPKNLFSLEPIIVTENLESVAYLENTLPIVQGHQKVQFQCKDCNKTVTLVYVNFNKHKQLLCRACLQKQTCLARYGVTNVLKLPETWSKIKETNIAKYGADNPIKSEIVKAKIWKNRDQKAFSEKMKNVWSRKSSEARLHQKEAVRKAKANMTESEKRDQLEKRKATCRVKYGHDFYQGSDSWKQKLPEQIRKACKRYTFENETFDSSWELALWIYAKDHNEDIKRENCYFEYEFEGKKHLYFPDFLYKDKLVEIKGNHFLENARVQKKLQVARDYNIKVWLLADIQPYLKYMEEKEGKLWYRKYRNK